MENIEVTEDTFMKLFPVIEMLTKTELKEACVIERFYNSRINQRGQRIYNYVASVWQYYLTDINA